MCNLIARWLYVLPYGVIINMHNVGGAYTYEQRLTLTCRRLQWFRWSKGCDGTRDARKSRLQQCSISSSSSSSSLHHREQRDALLALTLHGALVWTTDATKSADANAKIRGSQHLPTRYIDCNYIMCTSEDIELLLNGGYFGRHLGFRTLRMWRKNGTLIFFKLVISSFKIKCFFAFTEKYTKSQMSFDPVFGYV